MPKGVVAKKETQCMNSACRHVHEDENADCVANCVSLKCYETVYSSNPLEPGEVDLEREGEFQKCANDELTRRPTRREMNHRRR
eukprot:CAMPEP_0194533084 /NCGR_PEP_ID=MMETSP0253-20130528/70857_1 /TAXON_ID=2966 /ORGANISM="Noctiluca scintillans" /LENGTH=83 /DNA_ID=CAMNT_0039378603 /DNA_START=160 /DNA_END=411 /DNA_ORIENTATION=+